MSWERSGGSCDFSYPISMPCTWALPPIPSLAIDLALGWGTQDLSSAVGSSTLPLGLSLRKGKDRNTEARGLGFYLPFHKYGPHLSLSLSGSWRRLRLAWWGAVSEEPRPLRWREKAQYVHKSRHTGALLCLRTLGLG